MSSISISNIYEPSEIGAILATIKPGRVYGAARNRNVSYFDEIISFDIETSSWRDDAGTKHAAMYEWTLDVCGKTIVGRTWEDYLTVYNAIVDRFDTNSSRRLVFWVHSLAYEFQFLRRRHTWEDVTALETRKPYAALTTDGIEYRCSYVLSGYSLANLGKQLQSHTVTKQVGDLDYRLLRHSGTPLTEKELGYCVADVKVVSAYIAEQLEAEEHICFMPRTKTGYVRRYCRDACTGADPKHRTSEQKKYVHIMKNLTIEPEEYASLKRAFQGGFTHANPWHEGEVLENVISYDFTSSYPTVMVAEQFPMGKGTKIDDLDTEKFFDFIGEYCCMFDLELTNVSARTTYENYISSSKCYVLEGREDSFGHMVDPVTANGRVVSAGRLCTTVTELDFKIIAQMYDWDSMRVANFWYYPKDYLPTPFVKAILKLYKDKTQLKGIEGMESEYQVSKGMLNSLYGMCVTDICRETPVYDDGWQDALEPEVQEELEHYNSSRGRFLYYPWGVWVTAYARYNLFTGILTAKHDYVYADTDSLKLLHGDKYAAYIEKYNRAIISKLKRAMKHHGLGEDDIAPESRDCVAHPLGVWDYEGKYDRFKALGAKRYMYEQGGKLHVTVAGLSKMQGAEYLEKQDDPFASFDNNLIIPEDYSGRMTHTYIDHEDYGIIVDYRGEQAYYHEMSSVHLEQSRYDLSISAQFLHYIKGLKEDYTDV